MGRSRTGVLLAALLVAAMALAGCSSDSRPVAAAGSAPVTPASSAGSPAGGGPTTGELSGTLSVFAAASLKVSFDQLRALFMRQHPEVAFPPISYNGSPTLATQIRNGAPADVFASADEAVMESLGGAITDRHDFATNTLQIAVAPGNPKHLTSLADLAKPGVITVICAPPVPCGAAAQRALKAAGVHLTPASEEQNVTAVLTKVETGDADAGLVYATDVHTADGKVTGVDFPQAVHAVNTYPIGVLKDSKNQSAARAFVNMVIGPEGQKVLAGVGFGKP